MQIKLTVSSIIGLALFLLNKILKGFMPVGIQSEQAVNQLQNSTYNYMEMQSTNTIMQYTPILAFVVFLIFNLFLFKRELKKMKKLLPLIAFCLAIFTTGCKKPFDTPEFVQIKNNQTAFVIPLEGDSSKQGKFASEDFLKSKQVATKRIQIPHRWVQTGRKSHDGKYIATVTVLVVDRTPVTREWTADLDKGSNAKDDGIWTESKDSVTFSTGFSCTAFIKEENTAKYLYNYPSASLSTLMDKEIKARIQSVVSSACAEWSMDELRGKKKEIIEAVRKDVIPFFEERGVSVTTIGMFGGFTYQNPEIQKAIDSVFKSQTMKEVALAEQKAQEIKNQTEIEKADAAAQAKMRVAEAEAKAQVVIAEAEAEKIKKLADAAKEAMTQKGYLELRQLEIEEKRILKWKGEVPTWQTGTDSNMTMMVQAPK